MPRAQSAVRTATTIALAVVVLFVAPSADATGATSPAHRAGAPQGATAETVTAVVAAWSHACSLSSAGGVRCWGSNTYGTLGTGDLRQPVGDAPGEMPDALVPVDLGAGHHADAIAAGGDTTCIVRDDGAVKCWGGNNQGQLGLGDTARRGWLPEHMGDTGLVDLGAGRTATQVAVGAAHACALLDGGDVRCWGDNIDGQLGLGDTADRGDSPGEMGDALPPVDLGVGRTATAIAAGSAFTCAVLDDGGVKCWGRSFRGQLGLGTTANRGDGPGEMGDALPAVDVGAGVTATGVTAGDEHACAVLDDGGVKCWGRGAVGQLGLGDTADRGDGPAEMGDALPAVDVGAGRTATAIAAGLDHTCALLDQGAVRCWGYGATGRLGQGDVATRGDGPAEMGDALPAVELGTDRHASAVSVGAGFSCAALDDGNVKCWGNNGSGVLGQGDTRPRGDERWEMGDDLPPIELGLPGPRLSVTQSADRTALVAGRTVHLTIRLDNRGDETLTGIVVDDVVAPACEQAVPNLAPGTEHVITCDRLTTGADAGRLTNTVVVDSDQTGPVHANPARVTVQPHPDEPPAVQVAAGTGHSCALLADGSVRCWGANEFGQLGTGDTISRGDGPGELGDGLPPVDLGTGRTATAIAAAGNHSCALLDNGRVRCWGLNDIGQLGLGDTYARGYAPGQMGDLLPPVDLGEGRTAVAITAGARGWVQPRVAFTCALLDDGSVKCWGWNADGQLGQGTTSAIGDQPGELGDALDPIDLGPGRTALAVDAGADNVCAVRDTHDVVCWGDLNDSTSSWRPPEDNVGDDPGEMGAALVPVNLGPGATATAVSTSSTHHCARLDGGSVKCWGSNNEGQLGLGTTSPAGLTDPLPDDHPTVDLGAGRTVDRLTTGGYHHTCALLDDATVKCWGNNGRGTLGQGDGDRRGDGPGEMADALVPVDLGTGRTAADVALGDFHVCAVLDDGTVKCWGANERGQLGLGDTWDRGDEPDELGDQLAVVDLGTPPPSPSLALAMTADQEVVEAGSTIDFHLTVANTGNVDLTGVTVSDPAAPDCEAALAVLPAGNEIDVDCSYTTTVADAGTFTNAATVQSDQTGAVTSDPVDVVVTLTHQPDLALELAGRPFVGDDVYGVDGAGQTVTATRRRGGRAVFYVRIGNDGAVADTFDLRRTDTSPGVTVRYFRARTATDLTATVLDRSYRTRTLAPGESVLVRVEATVRPNAAAGTRSISLRSRSTAEAARVDVVQARVAVR